MNPFETESLAGTGDPQRSTTDPAATTDPLATTDPFATIDPDLDIDPFASKDLGDHQGTEGAPAASTLGPISEQQLAQIRDARQKFSSVWEEGTKEPCIEEYLSLEIDSVMRRRLAFELILLDVEHREQHNKSLGLDEYLSRLPDCGDAVKSAFYQRRATVPLGFGSLTVPERKPKTEAIQHPNDSSSRYQPIDFHARGGLGVVYVAVDGELERLVALKEILAEHGEKPRYQEKFVFEAQVTGSLEHPGIVPVYGLGRYEDQQPFYAMRFIEGRSLKKAIEQFHNSHPRLSSGVYFGAGFRLLLRRLIDTCNAIHYAHDRGVVHRDIKPANVMLGSYGETLVVDWGLAKLVASQPSRSTSAKKVKPIKMHSGGTSAEGSTVGTPMYMSPEQARGENQQLDRRSDVYSLGVLLFNMVTGKHPVDGTNTRDVVLRVREGKTKHVSKVAPHAPGALGSICRKAMQFDPANRYSTALELVEDVDRWMNSEQVHAHIGHEAIMERSGRLIRRHWNWAIPVAIALIVIAVGATVAAIMINSAKVEARAYKKEAVDRYRDSRGAIDTWLVQSADALEFLPGTRAVRKRLLEIATEDYEKLSQRSSGDPELELERGRALVRLGDLLRIQHDFDAARLHYDEASKLFSTSVAEDRLSIHYRAEKGNIHARLGLALADQEKTEQAEQQYAIAIKTLQKLVTQTDDPLPRRLLAAAHVNAGELFSRVGDTERAIESLHAALAQYDSLTMSDGNIDLGIARARELLGRIYTAEGEYEKGMLQLDDAIDGMSSRVSAEPDHPEYLDALASAYISKATSYRARGMERQQFDALALSVGHYRDLNVAMPGHPLHIENLAITLVDLGVAMREAGLSSDAEHDLIEAHQLLSDLVSAFGQVPRLHEDLATCRNALGQVLLDIREEPIETAQLLAAATDAFEQLAQFDADRPEYTQRMAVAQSHYAGTLWRQEQDSRKDFEHAISALEQLIERDPDRPAFLDALASVHYRFAMALHQRDDSPTAQTNFEAARDLWMGIEQGRTARMAHQLAWLLATCPLESMVDLDQARRFADEAVELSPENSRYVTIQALVSARQGNAAPAIAFLERSKSIRGNWIDRDFFVLAMAQQLNGQDEEARRSFDNGMKWMDEHHPLNADIGLLRSISQLALQ